MIFNPHEGPHHAVPTLPHPVVFVVSRPSEWPELFEPSAKTFDIDDNHWRFRKADDCWIVLTYLRLLQRGCDVRVSDQFVSDSICVVGNHALCIRKLPYSSYVVACRYDSARPEICEHTIVQNLETVGRPTDHFINHWPQPGLLPRLADRGSRVERIVFKGSEANLWEPFRSQAFRDRLAALGCTLQIDALSTAGERAQWNDYRNNDLVLAVRDLTEKDFLLKPASKLVNAWIAGVPALLGPEKAFRRLRQSDLDYVEIKTIDEAVAAVAKLQKNPDLYQAMVKNGLERAEAHRTQAVVEEWIRLLSGDVAQGYEKWREHSLLFRWSMRPLTFAARALRHKRQVRRYRIERDHGFRPVSNRWT